MAALVAAHVLSVREKDVDARNKSGHDGAEFALPFVKSV